MRTVNVNVNWQSGAVKLSYDLACMFLTKEQAEDLTQKLIIALAMVQLEEKEKADAVQKK